MFSNILKVVFGLIVMVSLQTTVVNATNEPYVPIDPYKNGLYEARFPAACGPLELVNKILLDRGFVPTRVSLGRLQAHPDNEPVFMTTVYRNKDQLLVTIETPAQIEKCIMFLAFNTYEVPQDGEK